MAIITKEQIGYLKKNDIMSFRYNKDLNEMYIETEIYVHSQRVYQPKIVIGFEINKFRHYNIVLMNCSYVISGYQEHIKTIMGTLRENDDLTLYIRQGYKHNDLVNDDDIVRNEFYLIVKNKNKVKVHLIQVEICSKACSSVKIEERKKVEVDNG